MAVGLMNERADVKFDKASLSDHDIEAMITDLGYPATLVSEDELKENVDLLVGTESMFHACVVWSVCVRAGGRAGGYLCTRLCCIVCMCVHGKYGSMRLTLGAFDYTKFRPFQNQYSGACRSIT